MLSYPHKELAKMPYQFMFYACEFPAFLGDPGKNQCPKLNIDLITSMFVIYHKQISRAVFSTDQDFGVSMGIQFYRTRKIEQ